jgi:hypothetical protein
MKTKNFKAHLASQFSKKELLEIESSAQAEYQSLKALQNDISNELSKYMSENDLGFNDLVRKLGKSPTQVSRMIKGDANLTLASVAQLFAMIGKQAHITAG